MTTWRVGVVAQPWDRFFPATQSHAIWVREITPRLAQRGCEVAVYHRDSTRQGVTHEAGVEYRFVPETFDGKLRRIMSPLPIWSARRPFDLSRFAYPQYWSGVARDLAGRKCDVLHVLNFPQALPVLRNAATLRVLHMNCQWLDQSRTATIRRSLRHAGLVLGCSEFITRATSDAFPTLACPTETLYGGVALDPQPASDPAPAAGTPESVAGFPDLGSATSSTPGPHRKRILFVGRLAPEKGIHVLLRAFEKVRSARDDVELELIGSRASLARFNLAASDDARVRALLRYYKGGDYARDYVEDILASVPAELLPWIRLSGRIPHSEVLLHYRRASVFVFPSVWPEPFGMPIVEALAAGVPVVATRVGAHPELVPAGAGRLVEPDDPDTLALAMLGLLDEDVEPAAAVARRAAGRFSWDVIADRLLHLYTQNLPPVHAEPESHGRTRELAA